MKTLYESIVVALAMYTKIPMPAINWNERNMRYSFLVLPFVGVMIGALLYALLILFKAYQLSPVFFAAAAVALPVVITGGLHFDGFSDTTDALASNQDKQEKLRILKDPHIGSFAVVYCIIVFLLQFGAWYELYQVPQYSVPACAALFFSRVFIALAIVAFPCARTSGLASIFSGYAAKVLVQRGLIFYLVVAFALLLWWRPIVGLVTVAGSLAAFGWFHRMTQKHFGGITGDLAGFYLVLYETGALFAVALIGGVLS